MWPFANFHLLFLSMVHEYAYFVMNIFGNRSIIIVKKSCSMPNFVQTNAIKQQKAK